MPVAPVIQSQAHVTQLHFGRGMERASALGPCLNNGKRCKQQHTSHAAIICATTQPLPLNSPVNTHSYQQTQWQYATARHITQEAKTDLRQAEAHSPLPTSELQQIATQVGTCNSKLRGQQTDLLYRLARASSVQQRNMTTPSPANGTQISSWVHLPLLNYRREGTRPQYPHRHIAFQP
jgi:hypothetical protein